MRGSTRSTNPATGEVERERPRVLAARVLMWSARQPFLALLLILACTTAAVFGLPKLRLDVSQAALIDQRDPLLPFYDRLVAQFGSDYVTTVVLEADDLFTPEKLGRLEDLHYDLEAMPSVIEVESLLSAPAVTADEGGGIDTTPIMDVAPRDGSEVDRLLARMAGHPLVDGILVSKDRTTSVLRVKFRPDWDDADLALTANAAIAERIELDAPHFERVFQVGPPRLFDELRQAVIRDNRVLLPVSALVLLVCMGFVTRSPRGATLPVLTGAASVLWSFGLFGWLGIPLNILGSAIPVLLFCVGSTEDAHLFTAYLRGLPTRPERSKRQTRLIAVAAMANKVGVTTFVTGFTTCIAFGAGMVSDLRVMFDFSLGAALALLLNLVATVLVVPLYLSLIGPVRSRVTADDGEPRGSMGRVFRWAFWLVGRRERSLIISAMVLGLAGMAALATLQPNNDPLASLHDSHPLVRDVNRIRQGLGGSHAFYLTIDADEAGYFAEPNTLARLQDLHAFIASPSSPLHRGVSFDSHISLVERALRPGTATSPLPETSGEVEQYTIFFTANDLRPYVTDDLSTANVIVWHDLTDTVVLFDGMAALEAEARKLLGDEVRISLVSQNVLVHRAVDGLVYGQALSFLIVAIAVALLLALLFSSVRLGAVSLIPNLLPALSVFGLMALLGWPLNIGTMMVVVVLLGVAVDDTIHLMTSFATQSRTSRSPVRALRRTLATQFLPVTATSFALCAGFLVLTGSDFTLIMQIGVLGALGLLVAMLADLLITPIFLRRVRLVGIWELIGLEVGTEPLKETPLFKGMSEWMIRRILVLAGYNQVPAGDIVRQGERGHRLYVLLSGRAVVVHRSSEGKESQLAELRPGDVFGEVAFVGATMRTASVRALEPVWIVEFSDDEIKRALRLYPAVARTFYRNLAELMASRLQHALETRT